MTVSRLTDQCRNIHHSRYKNKYTKVSLFERNVTRLTFITIVTPPLDCTVTGDIMVIIL